MINDDVSGLDAKRLFVCDVSGTAVLFEVYVLSTLFPSYSDVTKCNEEFKLSREFKAWCSAASI